MATGQTLVFILIFQSLITPRCLQDEKFIQFVKLTDTFLSAADKLETMHINLNEHRGGFKNIVALTGDLDLTSRI